jgi:hypothetical protein
MQLLAPEIDRLVTPIHEPDKRVLWDTPYNVVPEPPRLAFSVWIAPVQLRRSVRDIESQIGSQLFTFSFSVSNNRSAAVGDICGAGGGG